MKKVAILAEDLYNEVELWVPYYRLLEEGHDVKIVGSGNKSDYTGKFGYPVKVDILSSECISDEFDAVIVPGGFAPDKIRLDKSSLEIVKNAYNQGKIVATICHGGWVLASCGILKDKTITSYIGIKDDVSNAGANYVDQAVVVDGNLITSRTPADLPDFCRELVKALA